MKAVAKKDKAIIVDILSKSFDDNQSINYIVKQDHKRKERIRHLMDYCFEVCLLKGQMFLSEDDKACALILQPGKTIGFFKTIYLDVLMAIQCIGLSRIGKVMKREKLIKAHQPDGSFYYLWFIGVHPDCQGMGIGSRLVEEVFKHYEHDQKPFYLETSVLRNLPWYERYGFKIINELDIGYKLYQMIRN